MEVFEKCIRVVLSSKKSFIIAAEVLIGILICIFSLLMYLYLTKEVLEKEFFFLDQSFSLFVYSFRTPALTSLMMLISDFGARVPIIITTLLSIVFLIKKHRKEAVVFCLALVIGFLLNSLFKFLVARPRPEMSPLVIEMTSSFPSGHSMNAFIFYSLFSYFSFHFFRNKSLTVAMIIVSIAIVTLVGLSRIYLGVHYLTDVVGGYIAGFWWFTTVLIIDRTLVLRNIYKQTE